MILTRNNNNKIIANLVNQTMLFGNSSAPASFELVFERLRFNCSFKGFISGFKNQSGNLLEYLFIKMFSFQKLLVSNRFKKKLSHFFRYLSMSTSMSLPSLTSFSDSFSMFRLAFTGKLVFGFIHFCFYRNRNDFFFI